MSSNTPTALPSTKDIVNHVFSDVKEYSKLAGQIPADDYDYHLAFPGFRKHIRDHSASLIDVMDKCCQLLPKRRRISLEPEDASAPNLSDAQRTAVMETIDSFLENVDSVLDDLKGRKMHSDDQLSVAFGSVLGGSGLTTSADSANGVVQIAHVMRPQLAFERPVDNTATPFVPVYHDEKGVEHTGQAGVHPFAKQINDFAPTAEQLVPKPETPYLPLSACPLRFVDSTEALQSMVAELLQQTEIAVDLEHHDFYTYQGITCLMQVSSRTSDYIVDCLRLRSSMHLLAPVFLNPNILKVFHGAREDIRWLQKDFALYLVNFFDTGIALQMLHMPYSLAFAVDHFCQVRLNKKYQTADWRVRPLPAEMVEYARQDTHYLLYIYDRLRALLLNSESRAAVGNLLVHAYKESRQLSLSIYEKPVLNPSETYKLALGRSLGGLSAVQERVCREVFNWRDSTARVVDDSPTAVLHLSSVLAIAAKLPTTAKDLLRCCSPVSASVRQHVAHLVSIVLAALEADPSGGAAAHSAKRADDASSSITGGQQDPCVGHRSIGVYRPMTGALPSIGTRWGPATPSSTSQCVGGQGPSAWFTAMQQLAKRVAARPFPQVPLPGSETIAILQAHAKASATAKKVEAKEEASVEKKPAVSASRGESVANEEEVVDEAPEGFTESEVRIKATAQKVEAGAVSLRQAYGTGPNNRKKARKTSPSTRKK